MVVLLGKLQAVDGQAVARYFNESEWKMLRELDTRTNQRIHDGENNTGWQIVLRCPATHPRTPSAILY
ncbi:hypothetical protein PC114_g15682 [Phytophthora cactorum]|nr:hypothetical protein PC114_g15682 [Phytophthora cactorum]KAG2925925.1 hypothetical protein PC117_g15066 [Phytophthora cactorum]KAG3000692.1 hypothetical protein PC120_g20636 [Phytophthora cactorum]